MTQSIDLFSTVLLLGAAQGLFLTILLFKVRSGNKRANRYLALFVLLFSITLIDEFMTQTRYYLQYPHLLGLIWPTNFLYGPLGYLYVKALTSKKTLVFEKREFLHFIPFVADIFYNIPDYLLSAEKKVEYLFRSEGLPLGAFYLDLNNIGPLVQSLIYLILSFQLLSAHAHRIKDDFSYVEQINLKWLRNLLIALMCLWFMYLFSELVSPWFSMVYQSWYSLHVMVVVVVYTMGYFGVRQPAIFTRLLAQPSVEAQQKDLEATATEPPPVKVKYQKSALSFEQGQALLSEIQQRMESEQPYLDDRLTMPQLAARFDLSPNYLSQIINEQLHKNFFDFVNHYRIEEAKRRLVETLEGTSNVLTIAFAVGFNSKSAFYTAFKKHTQMTPSQFRKLARE